MEDEEEDARRVTLLGSAGGAGRVGRPGRHTGLLRTLHLSRGQPSSNSVSSGDSLADPTSSRGGRRMKEESNSVVHSCGDRQRRRG